MRRRRNNTNNRTKEHQNKLNEDIQTAERQEDLDQTIRLRIRMLGLPIGDYDKKYHCDKLQQSYYKKYKETKPLQEKLIYLNKAIDFFNKVMKYSADPRSNEDALKKRKKFLLLEKANFLINILKHYTEGIEFYEKNFKLNANNNNLLSLDDGERIFCYQNLAYAHFELHLQEKNENLKYNNLQKSYSYIKNAYNTNEDGRLLRFLIDVQFVFAHAEYARGNAKNAIELLKKNIALIENNPNSTKSDWPANNNNKLGSILHHQKEFHDALGYFEEAEKLYQQENLKAPLTAVRHMLINIHYRLGTCSKEISQYKIAKEHFNSAIQLAQKNGERRKEAMAMRQLALINKDVILLIQSAKTLALDPDFKYEQERINKALEDISREPDPLNTLAIFINTLLEENKKTRKQKKPTETPGKFSLFKPEPSPSPWGKPPENQHPGNDEFKPQQRL